MREVLGSRSKFAAIIADNRARTWEQDDEFTPELYGLTEEAIQIAEGGV